MGRLHTAPTYSKAYQETHMTFQRGGTILGLIIGVLVGLGGALAVAVYVTKVPVPFVNKGTNHSPEQDAAEAQKNKNWDPNTPLYGKNPVRPASAAAGSIGTAGALPSQASNATNTVAVNAASARPAAANAPGNLPANTSSTTPAKTDAKAVSQDPLGDLAKARSAAAPAVTTAAMSANSSADPFTYFVQAGAYRSTEDAEAQRAKLSLLGVEAKVTEREQSGRTVYRVRVGPFDKKDDAEKTKDKLDATGTETALVRIAR